MSFNPDQDISGSGAVQSNFLYRAVSWLNTAFLVVSAVFVVLMMIHVTADVLLRTISDYGITGTLEVVSYYYMVCAIFLAFGYVELQNQHIRVDLFVQQMPRSAQVFLYVLACLAGLAFLDFLPGRARLMPFARPSPRKPSCPTFSFTSGRADGRCQSVLSDVFWRCCAI